MKEIPIDPKTVPHRAIDTVVRWLGVGYETTVTRKSDGKKLIIRITEEDNATRTDSSAELDGCREVES